MKRVFEWILYVVLSPLAIPLILLWIIGLILYTPIDYIKYKYSLFYKTERKKYSWLITRNINFSFYNIILKNNLPIEFFHNSQSSHLGKRGWLESGWFVYDGTLIIFNDYFKFNSDNNKGEWIWGVAQDEDDDVEDGEESDEFTIDRLIESEINAANKAIGKTICDKAIILTKHKNIDNIELAKNDPRFVIYEKNIAEVVPYFLAAE